MRRVMMNRKTFLAGLAVAILTELGTGAVAAGPPIWLSDDREAVGVAYTMTNDPTGNEIVILDRAANGRLTVLLTSHCLAQKASWIPVLRGRQAQDPWRDAALAPVLG
jgi:hypothetical protein